LGRVGGQPLVVRVSYHHLPTGGMRGWHPFVVRSGLARVSNHEATYGPILRDARL